MHHTQAAHLSGISTSLMCSVSRASSSRGIPALARVSQDLTEEPKPHSSAVRSADRADSELENLCQSGLMKPGHDALEGQTVPGPGCRLHICSECL